MKKLLALVFALMLFAVPVLAETYTHPTQGFSVECPEGWLAVDAANIDDYIAAYENGEMTFTGLNKDTLTQLKAQITAQDATILIDPLANNIVIAGADIGMPFTMDVFQAAMTPTLLQKIQSGVPGITFVDEGSIVEMNGRQYMTIVGTYEMNGVTVGVQQIYYLEGTCMYVFNVTVTSLGGADYLLYFDTLIDQVLNSFNSNK